MPVWYLISNLHYQVCWTIIVICLKMLYFAVRRKFRNDQVIIMVFIIVLCFWLLYLIVAFNQCAWILFLNAVDSCFPAFPTVSNCSWCLSLIAILIRCCYLLMLDVGLIQRVWWPSLTVVFNLWFWVLYLSASFI